MNILDTIVEEKKREVARLPARRVTADDLRAAMRARGDRRDFLAALRHASRPAPRAPRLALIAEVKKASPSAGLICPDFDPVRVAQAYAAAGADCLSVLTDEKFFQGSLDYLRQIRAAVKLPLLRKDFIIDERQLLEAVEAGADAVLLIVAILTDAQLAQFHSLAVAGGLAVLVEVHDEAELARALRVNPEIIGVNNRDLKTFQVDLATTETLAAKLADERWRTANAAQPSSILHPPSSILLVAESGIRARADVDRLRRAGAGAILVGESLMREADLGAKIRELLGRAV